MLYLSCMLLFIYTGMHVTSFSYCYFANFLTFYINVLLIGVHCVMNSIVYLVNECSKNFVQFNWSSVVWSRQTSNTLLNICYNVCKTRVMSLWHTFHFLNVIFFQKYYWIFFSKMLLKKSWLIFWDLDYTWETGRSFRFFAASLYYRYSKQQCIFPCGYINTWCVKSFCFCVIIYVGRHSLQYILN